MSVLVCGRIRPLGRINVPEHSPCALRAQGHINMLRLLLHRKCVHSIEHTSLYFIFSLFKTFCALAKVFILFFAKVSQIENLTLITYRLLSSSKAKLKQSERFGLTARLIVLFGGVSEGASPFMLVAPSGK